MAGLTNPMQTQPAAAPAQPMAASPAPAAPAAPAAAPAAAPPAAGAQPGAQAQPGAGAQNKAPIGAGPVDPELMKKYVANCMNVVTGSLQAIAKMIQQSQDKPTALAQAVLQVIIRVEDSLEQSGGQLNLSMTMEGGGECLSDIVDAMQKMGVYDYSQQEINQAFLLAVDKYRMFRQQQGRLNPAMFQQKMQQLKQAQANGSIDQAYPGLTQFAQKTATAMKTPASGKGGKQQPGQQPQQSAGADQDNPATDPSEADGAAPATGTQNFPASMLKKKPNQVTVTPHYRRFPKKRKAPPIKPGAQPGGMSPPKKPKTNTPPNNGAM